MSSPYQTGAEVKEEKPQSFPLEKILRISAGEYCKRVGKQVSDYEIHGIQVGGNSQYDLGLFVGLVPKNAEVVVAYQTVKENRGVSLKGTALIPKYELLPDTGVSVPIKRVG